jgi:hypothetical protein
MAKKAAVKVVPDGVLEAVKEVEERKAEAVEQAKEAAAKAEAAKQAKEDAAEKLEKALAPLRDKRNQYVAAVTTAHEATVKAREVVKTCRAAEDNARHALTVFDETSAKMGIPKALLGGKRPAKAAPIKNDAERKTLKPGMVGKLAPVTISVPRADKKGQVLDVTVSCDGDNYSVMFEIDGVLHKTETPRLSQGIGRFAETKDVAYAVARQADVAAKYPLIKPVSAIGAIKVNGRLV